MSEINENANDDKAKAMFINGCYVSKRQALKVRTFLKSQGLNNSQVDSVSAYFFRRITSAGNKAVVVGAVLLLIGFAISEYLLW